MKRLSEDRDGGDGTSRSSLSLRRLYMESGGAGLVENNIAELASSLTGSSLVELGHTKVVCQVNVAPANEGLPEDSTATGRGESSSSILVTVEYAPFAIPVDEIVASLPASVGTSSISQINDVARSLRSEIQSQQSQLSSCMSKALVASVPWPPQGQQQQSPLTSSVLQVKLTVLQDDGGVLNAAMLAASLAIADASVEQYDVLVCGSVACVRTKENDGSNGSEMKYLADPDWADQNAADATMVLAMLPNLKEVLMWEQSGALSVAEANKAMEVCRNGCRTMHKFLRQHWLDQRLPSKTEKMDCEDLNA